MRHRVALLASVVLLAGAMGCGSGWVRSQAEALGVPTIRKEELRSRLGSPHLVILDVRSPEHWEPSRFKVPGAVREESEKVTTWASKYAKADAVVLYCS